jgi:hypothetical protein
MRGKWQDGEELGGAEEHMICPAAPILAEGPAQLGTYGFRVR